MIILDANKENQADIEALNHYGFRTPDLSDPFYVAKKLVIADGKIIGAGLVKLTTEGILILDSEVSKGLRTFALKQLIESCKNELKKINVEECHVFVPDGNLQALLKRLGFIFCKGPAMVLHF